jgi:formylglycine-generating enzyme required for sulfatase activity
MYLFFQADISKQLDARGQNLLQLLIKEAPQKKIDALKEYLNSDRINNNQRRYVLDCLKTIGTPEAIQTIETANKENWDKANRAYADEIIAEESSRFEALEKQIQSEGVPLQSSIRNPFEGNVEYINISGGIHKYSVTGRVENVPGFYLCKYPVTNKRYRRFISFLAGSEKALLEILPLEIFAQRLLKFATPIKGYTAFLGENFTEWQVKLRSRLDDDKKFYDDDQPTVAVSWYAARAYCFWLSCLDIAMRGDVENPDIHQLASIYRLPTEKEWEWAAAGREPGGSPRKYPWPAYKGEPTPELANYNKNVGATTPVGRCPEGATPEGLMDMAGNAWEWMDNYYDAANNWYALRGGSWYDGAHHMRCAARSNGGPDYLYDVIGFRVLRTCS